MDLQAPVDYDLVQSAARRLVQRQTDREQRCAARRERAVEFASKLAAHIGAVDSSVEKVIGFGSTFEAWRYYHESSDIDLAIIGGNWVPLWREVPHSEFEVSLIELPLQNQEFIEHVLRVGVVLYENYRHD